MRSMLLVGIVLVGSFALPSSAAAIGYCEGLTAESTVVGVSVTLRQVAVLRIDETCREVDDPEFGGVEEERNTTRVLQIYNRRGKLVKKFAVESGRDATKHRYVVRHKFVNISSNTLSPSKRCRVSGLDSDESKYLRVRGKRRTLFSKNLSKTGNHIEATPYWFKAGKLLILHLNVTSNPGHYAQHTTSSIQLVAAGKHRMGTCFR